MSPTLRWLTLGIALVVVIFAVFVFYRQIKSGQIDARAYSDPTQTARFVGGAICASCHGDEAGEWLGSHHDLAMQEVSKETVAGDFDNAIFEKNGVTSRFFTRDGEFYVETENSAGQMEEFRIAYVFGVDPLQQYLVEFADGRIQVLSLCWDTRPASDGGQRWFHLYPDEIISHSDALHWTQSSQNWNYMCADCHSTNLRKNFDPDRNSFATTWAEIDVSCEACHGAGSRHVEWARDGEGDDDPGLLVRFSARGEIKWRREANATTATPDRIDYENLEMEACAPCHSRRGIISDQYVHGDILSDHYRMALLGDSLYYPDGQIRDEVYVLGSFLQSRMHQNGVSCSDCHNPHTLKLVAEGNALCGQCHSPAAFDTPDHHFHEAGDPGSACVDCHMPERTYMVVDPRRDHRFGIPRPLLTSEIGTPNACNGCHEDRSAEWADRAITRALGIRDRDGDRAALAFFKSWRGDRGAGSELAAVLADTNLAVMTRASATQELEGRVDGNTLPYLKDALNSEDPLVRRAGVTGLNGVAESVLVPLMIPMLKDPVLSVRLEAARVLSPVAPAHFTPDQLAELDLALEEYIQSQLVNADRADSYFNIGVIHVNQTRLGLAEKSFRRALARDRSFVPAYVNLADLYRATDRDAEGESLLRTALEHAPQNAEVHHALGLLLVRETRNPEALAELKVAAQLRPGEVRFWFVYAVALHATGDISGAIEVLQSIRREHPLDLELLQTLVHYTRDLGDQDATRRYAQELLEVEPGNPLALEILKVP